MQEFSFAEPEDFVPDMPAAYCAAWPLLPIHHLIVRGIVTDHVQDSLAETTRLTSLLLHYDRSSSATLQQLAAALKPLKKLQRLDVAWDPDHPDSSWWSDDVKLGCVSALVELPELSTLWLKGLSLPRAAAEEIGKLQQLTSLRLVSCDIDDYCVNVVAVKLTGRWCCSSVGHRAAQGCMDSFWYKHEHAACSAKWSTAVGLILYHIML